MFHENNGEGFVSVNAKYRIKDSEVGGLARSGLRSSTTVIVSWERLRSRGGRAVSRLKTAMKKAAFTRLCNRWNFNRKSEHVLIFQVFLALFFGDG
jgi:hypothetical protein